MTTLLLLLVALSSIPFATLYEKHINYISEKDLGRENTKSNFSIVDNTGNCSRADTEETSRKVLKPKTTNEGLTVGNGNRTDAITKASVESLKGGWNAKNTTGESKLLFV